MLSPLFHKRNLQARIFKEIQAELFNAENVGDVLHSTWYYAEDWDRIRNDKKERSTHHICKMQIAQYLKNVFFLLIFCRDSNTFTVTRGKEYRTAGDAAVSKDAVPGEPTCEELKAMWRFSKRQSRAAEITNEIPTYRDPFSYNVWEPYYARSRSMGGSRPVYGRVVHKAPMLRIQDSAERNRAFEEVARMYGNLPTAVEPRRRITAFRLSGGMPSMKLTPQSGSFQHLKELIRTERARELQEQRMAEEAAARAAALKELSGSHKTQSSLRDLNYNYDIDDREVGEDQESLIGRGGILTFPDLFAPSAGRGAEIDENRYLHDQSYFKDRPKTPSSSSLIDSDSFNNEFDEFLF
ncbi:hypothetical protein QE152_g22911 [Popillia japonica]|uniref:Uncharacterized protein n=1 Tax=Popillia japonica TaxID=7064 RepID=A0AAW1KJ77_POPJA